MSEHTTLSDLEAAIDNTFATDAQQASVDVVEPGMVAAVETLSMQQALNRALAEVLGEDVGLLGGVFRITDGLQKQFGEDRVFTRRWPNPASWACRWAWPWPAT